jgi:hypothetical protein
MKLIFNGSSILLLGNHAALFYDELKHVSGVKVNTLRFKKKKAFTREEPNRFVLNDISIDYNGNYVLDELTFALNILINHNSILSNTLVVGDPSELIFQSFVYAKTNQNPNLIREEVQFASVPSNDAFVFLYPVGMVAQNIRKEISALVYVLKKFKNNTYLIRSQGLDAIDVLQKMLNSMQSDAELFTFEMEGVQQLISNQRHFST